MRKLIFQDLTPFVLLLNAYLLSWEKDTWRRLVRILLMLTASCALVACAASPNIVDHAFTFDAISDSPDVYVLDYRYGTSKLAMTRNPEYLQKEGKSLQGANVNGPMQRGESLYVKWRIKSTGQIHEDTVDLDKRLPANIENYRIYFMIRGPQLYVYLISPERRSPDVPPNGPRPYSHLKTTTIYPDQAKQ